MDEDKMNRAVNKTVEFIKKGLLSAVAAKWRIE